MENVYCHIPFCRSKCGYCAFYSVPGCDESLMRDYAARLGRDLSAYRWSVPVETVYFGGGTPTLLAPELLADLMGRISVRPDAERSIEGNPETLDSAKLEALHKVFNRFSLGVQSFDASLRGRLGRNCSDAAIKKALACLRGGGWRFNLDLMYAIPGETRAMFRRDLECAAASGAEHISCYALTPEEGTRLAGTAVDDDLAAAMWEDAECVLGRRGIRRYEISNYARPGCECRHNVRVWRGGRLAGFGATASGYDGVCRATNTASLTDYVPEPDELPPEARAREIFAVNLRTVAGWTPELWDVAHLGLEWAEVLDLARLASARYPGTFAELSDCSIRLSNFGLSFWDTVAMELL